MEQFTKEEALVAFLKLLSESDGDEDVNEILCLLKIMKVEGIDKSIKTNVEVKIKAIDDVEKTIKNIVKSLKNTDKEYQIKTIAYGKQISLVDNHRDHSEFNIYFKVAEGLGIDINSKDVQEAWEKIDLR